MDRRPSGPTAQPPMLADRRGSGPTYRPFDVAPDRWKHETQSGSSSSLRTPLIALGAVIVVGGVALAIAGVATGFFSSSPAPDVTPVGEPSAAPAPPLARPDPSTDLVDPPRHPLPLPAAPGTTVAAPSPVAPAGEGLLDRPLVQPAADAGTAAAAATDRRRRPPPPTAPPAPTKRARGPFATEYPD
ncbi:MAG: hypothetical protein IT379_13795 [Deltaproteobacteria bacterium]|nr:hypothetical protein [Deltaproteobacteria bacterium]